MSKSNALREEFYNQLSRNVEDYELRLLRKVNRYLDWNYFDRLRNEGKGFFF